MLYKYYCGMVESGKLEELKFSLSDLGYRVKTFLVPISNLFLTTKNIDYFPIVNMLNWCIFFSRRGTGCMFFMVTRGGGLRFLCAWSNFSYPLESLFYTYINLIDLLLSFWQTVWLYQIYFQRKLDLKLVYFNKKKSVTWQFWSILL